MSRNRAIALFILAGIVAAAIGAFLLLPRHYKVGERLTQATVFWHDKEAFVFLDLNTTGEALNAVEEKILGTRYGYLISILGAGGRFFEYRTAAYRVLPSGEVISAPLPPGSAQYGSWSLQAGNLQMTPVAIPGKSEMGFRWDGNKFVSVAAKSMPHAGIEDSDTLRPDDASDDDADADFLNKASRAAFRAAGWHWKQVGGYEGTGTEATLPISLGKAPFDLVFRSFPRPTAQRLRFDSMEFGLKSLAISAAGQPDLEQTIWTQKGWQEISKDQFEQRARASGPIGRVSGLLWVWVVVLLFFGLLKFGAWGHFLFSLFGMKRRMLKNLATSYSFPPATPAQFPQLDNAALDRYTQEFERMGFVRLLDFSLVSDAPNPLPSFCRLFVHTRNHCFGEAAQVFPRGKAPLPLRCSIQSSLEDGWTLAFSDRKPLATSSIIRTKRAIGVSMPGATPNELLNSFLQMRSQICQDLGISVVNDDTLEAYVAKVQRGAKDRREAIKQRNFARAIPNLYLRKFSLLKTKPEYIWLGDYPKEAERRKQGFVTPAQAL
jgi:hypothetical protein